MKSYDTLKYIPHKPSMQKPFSHTLAQRPISTHHPWIYIYAINSVVCISMNRVHIEGKIRFASFLFHILVVMICFPLYLDTFIYTRHFLTLFLSFFTFFLFSLLFFSKSVVPQNNEWKATFHTQRTNYIYTSIIINTVIAYNIVN